MQIHTKIENDILILYLQGNRLDSSDSMDFKEKIQDVIKEGATKIIVNMEMVDFIDSSGLAALIVGYKELRNKGELKIATPGLQLQSLINHVHLDKLLKIYSKEQDAIDSFNNNIN